MNPHQPQNLSLAEKQDWLRLIRTSNVGPITFFKLLERFGNAADAIAALPDLARRGGRRAIKVYPKAAAQQELAALDALDARLVAWGEPDYPPLLAHIEDAPPLLSVRGHVGLLRKRTVAVVGARNASVNGLRLARAIASDLGQGGLMVVSGMARGIDTAAHQGALPTGTTAVLGGGVDVIYPKENTELYQHLLESGAIISEVAPGVQPQARHFPRRNRLISGMARGVVVIEAGPRSGSLITARMALEQGREVFAVPGAPGDPRSQGSNKLIREGANLTESAQDVFRVFQDMLKGHLESPKIPDFKAKKPIQPDLDEVEKHRQRVISFLSPTPITVDELLRHGQISVAVAATLLLELELAGRLERHPGNRVSLITA